MNSIRISRHIPRTAMLVVCLSTAFGAKALATQIDWASAVVSSTAAGAANGLGRPDLLEVSSLSVHQLMSFGGFGLGQSDSYSTAGFASFLGVSLAKLAQADFIVFEGNGATHIPFESSTWTFTDGANQLVVPYVNGSVSGPVVALGNITPASYASFFGTPVRSSGDMAYILFDVDGSSSVNVSSSAFQVTMDGPGDKPGHVGSPDPDAFGRINAVPDSSVFAPALLILATLSGVAWRRKEIARAS